MNEHPKGMIALLIAPDGHVVTSVSDFDRSSVSDQSNQDTQYYRVRRLLEIQTIEVMCNSNLAKVIISDVSMGWKIMNALINKAGYKRLEIPIGYNGG